MKQHKPGKKAFQLTGLTLLFTLILCIGLLIVSTGNIFARYRAERQKDVTVQVRKPEMVLLGTIENGEFTSSDRLEWVVEDNVASLKFAVANGASETDFSTKDQAIQLCMIGSLGILKDGEPPWLSVTFIPQKGNGEERTVTATASSIVEGTALYHSYGPGWLYRFYETTAEGNRELTWELPGGSLSYVILTVKTDGDISGLLQPLVSAEPIDD